MAGGVAASGIARWNGSTWSAIGAGLSATVSALALLPNGDLVAGGSFVLGGMPHYIVRWNGVSWSGLGTGPNGPVNCLLVLPGGDLIVGGSFTSAGGVGASGIARWNGSTWAALDSGVNGGVAALTLTPGGDLMVGGVFREAGGLGASLLAQLTSTCPAATAAFGAGCASSAGPMMLAATALPWIGGWLQSRCTGMAATGLGFCIFGFGRPNTPLASLHPAGGPGCTLLASPDGVLMALPVAGRVECQVALPYRQALVGLVLDHQVLQVELTAAGGILAVTASNGLSMTVGSF